MMKDIDLSDCDLNEQRFFDININDNETEPVKATNDNKKSLFNFINSSSSPKQMLKKSKPESQPPVKSNLTTSVSYPISSKNVCKQQMTVKSLTEVADVLLDNLNDIDLNSSEISEDDDDDQVEENFNDKKLIELNRNVQMLKKNYLASPSLCSLKEADYRNYCENSTNLTDLLKNTEHSTPLRSLSSSSIENLNDSNDMNKTLNSLSDQNDQTLSFSEDNQQSNETSNESNHSKSFDRSGLREMLSRNDSIVDGLLGDIYDRFNISLKESFNESDAFTDQTMSSSNFTEAKSWLLDSDMNEPNTKNFGKSYQGIKSSLKKLDIESLRSLNNELTLKSNQTSAKLIRNLRQKDKLLLKLDKNCDILTSILQARSLKRRVDTQMKFTIDPMPGEAGFIQWKDAMKALVRLPGGVPKEFRKSVWLNLSKQYIKDINLDWNKVRRIAFNDRSNPDDHELGIQIVKDLHRTGCSAFSGSDNEQDRALLKRVLLAFARYNKSVGYCQGFNIIAAQILEIVDKKEEDAFMCMIYLIDHILPEGYFTNSMHSLAIDMAVFRELLKCRLPKLCQHLNALQFNSITETRSPLSLFSKSKSKLNENPSNSSSSSSTYEPPLTNVFTMQWFLTLFATCLPRNVLLRIWDCLFLEGAEILFRTSIAIWDKLGSSVVKATSADSFYSMMSVLTVNLFEKNVINENDFMNKIYSYGPFPLQGLEELREKLTFNITPFQQGDVHGSNRSKKGAKTRNGNGLSSMKLNSEKGQGGDDGMGNQKDQSLIPDIDELDFSRGEPSLRKTEDVKNSKYFYDDKEDDDEVEDLAKMISCFTLLMPNRSITSSAQNSLPHSSTRNDIIIQSMAAASAYGTKLATSNKSKKLEQLATPQKIDDATPGAFSYITQMYNPKPLGEHLSSDLNELKKQYKKLKERQQQAFVIVHTASNQHRKKQHLNMSMSAPSLGYKSPHGSEGKQSKVNSPTSKLTPK